MNSPLSAIAACLGREVRTYPKPAIHWGTYTAGE
jgi:hypothetical protein